MVARGEDYKHAEMKLKLIPWLALAFATVATAEAARPFKETASGSMHQPSGVVFPNRVGAFRRIRPNVYDNAGRDVSMRYMLGAAVIADAYVYPVTKTTGGLDKEFRTQQKAIKQLNRNVRLVAQETVSLVQNGQSVTGKHAMYTLERTLQSARYVKAESQLYVMREGNWFIAYRFSYPLEKASSVAKQVKDFLNRWQWRAGTTRV